MVQRSESKIKILQKRVLTNTKEFDKMPKAIVGTEVQQEAEKNLKKVQKKLLTKQKTCAKLNKLLLSSNSTLTNKQQCNPERFLNMR